MTTKMMGLARNAMTFGQGDAREATETETYLGLCLKLHEEVAEVILDPTDVTEYADVLEVLQTFAALNDVSWHDVEAARAVKSAERGDFYPPMLWTSHRYGDTEDELQAEDPVLPDSIVPCPKCDRTWHYGTQQARNIELVGGCIACHVEHGHGVAAVIMHDGYVEENSDDQ